MEERQENPIACASIGQDQLICETKEWRPSRLECLREYDVKIKFLSMGCIIEVGCKSIPFAIVEDGMKALGDYINNPYDSRKLWEERINKAQ